jgi:hypothetical protein
MELQTTPTHPVERRRPKVVAGALTLTLLGAVAGLALSGLGSDLLAFVQSGFTSVDNPLTFDAPTATLVKFDNRQADDRTDRGQEVVEDATVLKDWEYTFQRHRRRPPPGPPPPPPPPSGFR